MTYLNCPHCGLSVPAHEGAEGEGLTPCPRCLGRAELVVPMYATDRPRPPAEIRMREPQAA